MLKRGFSAVGKSLLSGAAALCPAFLVRWATLCREALTPVFCYLNLHLFGAALALSFFLHGATIATGSFGEPPPKKRIRDRGLDVTLVNSASSRRPQNPQVLAQANLDGGGNTEKNRRVKTPLPPSPATQEGNQFMDLQKRVESLERERRELLAASREGFSFGRAQKKETLNAPREKPKNGLDLADSAREMLQLEAEIDREIEAYETRPRKKFIGTKALEYRFAQYIEDWRQKVERWGTLNYPEAARGKIYGSLVLSVTIDRNGEVVDVTVDKPSPHKILNEAARRIVYMAAPYPPFPPAISRDTDQVVIPRTWTFTDRLKTK
ncbi:MAG: TonB family protein [Zoogloeaceae bacterium]|jgi:protein TonB|nr:TonB family protein [Zoogloeaceae bacterium]